MFGLIVLTALVAYVAFAIWITANVPRLLRIPVALLWIALPTADALLGRTLLVEKCEEGLRIEVQRTVAPVAAIYRPSAVFPDSPHYYGYKIVEGKPLIPPNGLTDPDQYVGRAIAQPDQKAILEKIARRTARFGLFEAGDSRDSMLQATRYYVKDLTTLEELGHFTWYTFPGGWVERTLGATAAATCGDHSLRHKKVRELLARTVPAE